ncbi:MAG: transglutaminase domain-containing protein [Flavobacteriales bacterium]
MTLRFSKILRPSALLTTLIITGIAVAQTPDEMLARYRSAHHDESSVYLQKNTTITIRRAATGLVADRSVEEERITLKTLAGQTQDDAVYYSGMVPLKSIAAYTLSPVKDKYKKLEVSRFTHKDEQDQKIFHDDSRSVDFLYPGVLPGAITHLDYDVSYPDARFVSGHFFATGVPVEKSTLTVVHEKDVAVDVRSFHIPEGAMTTTTTDKHGKVTDTYTMHNVPALQSAPDAPDFRYYAPHVQLVVRDLSTTNALAGQSDLMRLYRWYYSNIASVSATDDPELTAIAKEAVKGATTDDEKARKLYAWVQSNIKYVAVEDGMNGFIPFPAAKVCSSRYGDCKGMANLLRALLVNEGLDAHVAWTGSRELPYSYDDLPSTATGVYIKL